MLLRCGTFSLDLTTPIVMGVVNVTPDSFSDGGRWFDTGAAIEHALRLIDEGAGIVDIGGESTRPGAVSVSVDEELRRVIPVVAELARRVNVPVSVDTSRAAVISEALESGASLINDVCALRQPGALQAAADSRAGLCLMHMQGDPRMMQRAPEYMDVCAEVGSFLQQRVSDCEAAGIERERIAIDPGIGFGKSLEHNLALLAHTAQFTESGIPLLVGVSRKSIIGALTGRDVAGRLAGGLALATAAVLGGASIIRTHDVAPTVDAVKVAVALRNAGYKS